ncbi:hypothetical protein EDD16DRAFT_1699580 [Pisolithus croceorrhizus]|nr:hypothetical protein EDD16DRAFT_1699580 [Pisolithus croceorrhizus]
MSDWKQAYSEILSSYVGMYKEVRGNLELRNEILAEVKGKILEHEPLHSVELPQNLRVAIWMEWLSQLDPEDQQDEIAIIQQILTLAFTGKSKEDAVKQGLGFDCREHIDYLLTEPGEDDSAEKQEAEISLNEDGNPEVPTWGGQKLKVQQNLARAVFQAAYDECCLASKFTKKPKAKVPWGLLIKSPMKNLDPESTPEGFTMKDPSKWTKADLRLLWDHWQSLEAQDKVIASFIDCKKEDAPLCRQLDRKVVGSSKKRVWVTVDDDSEAEVSGAGIPGPSVTQHLHSVGGPSEQTVDGGEVLGEATTDAGQSNPEESSPAWHAGKDQISYLKSLSIMPRYQVLVDLVDAIPEQEHGKGPEVDFPYWATWTWSGKYLPEEIHLDLGTFQKATGELQSARFSSSSRGLEVVLGLGLLLRECTCAQEVEEDDPMVRDEEEEEEEAPPRKRKRAGSGIVTRGQKMAKKDEGKGKKVEENQREGVRT